MTSLWWLSSCKHTGIVWPLIAHAAWYSKFSLGLARALANEDSKGAPTSLVCSSARCLISNRADLPFDLLLLLHPLAFAAHKSLVRHMSDFNSFVQNYAAPQEDAAVSVARAVLSDITTGTAPHSVDLSAWTALVASLPTPSPEPVTTTISIAHDALPEEALASLREKARACLPVESSSIKVVFEGKMDEAPVDIITRAKLPAIVPSGVYRRQCTQCQGLSDAPRPPSIWAESSLEANWRLRCWCGGAWGLL